MATVVFRGTVVLPDNLQPGTIVIVEDGRIVTLGPERAIRKPARADVIDAADGYISPGFVDIHTHGGAGSDYMDGTPEAVRIANRAHARHGTTTIFPTTTTGTPAQLTAMLDAVNQVRRDWNVDGRRPDRGRPLVRAVLRHGQGRRTSQGLRAQSRSGGVRAGPGARHHQIGDVCRRASGGGRRSAGRPRRRAAWSPAGTPMRPGPRWRRSTRPACATSITSGTR